MHDVTDVERVNPVVGVLYSEKVTETDLDFVLFAYEFFDLLDAAEDDALWGFEGAGELSAVFGFGGFGDCDAEEVLAFVH